MIIGLDIGISSTKVVALVAKKLNKAEIWEGGFSEKQLQEFIFSLSSIGSKVEKIAVTGVGSKKISGKLLGYPTVMVDEFEANAASASCICNESKFIVVSMGSGTSFVEVDNGKPKHIGGSALGGGTILGLFKQMSLGDGWTQLRAMAERGSLEKIDLTVADVSDEPLPNLPMDTTVTNFGKIDHHATPQDIALGLINLTLQNIGVMAYLAGSGRDIITFVVIGRMTTLPHVAEIFERLNKLYGVNFILAKQSTHMTAIGAACAIK